MNASERFWAKVDRQPDGCWLWTASVTNRGYGQFRSGDGRTVTAHRFAYEEAHGPVPEGLVLHHTCETPLCVRASHLQPMTQADHKALDRKEFCGKGHKRPLDDAPGRKCSACHRQWRLRRRAAA